MTLTLEEKLKIYNWFYKLGEPLASDQKYNQMYQELRVTQPDSDIITKTWSEMRMPYEELKKAGLLDRANKLQHSLTEKSNSRFFLPEDNMKNRELYYNDIMTWSDKFIPKSIDTIQDIDDSRNWLFPIIKETMEPIEIHFSIKADGFNISLFYVNGYFIGARTRGRTGESNDVTIAMSKVVPLKVETDETYLRITVEAVMDLDTLTELRETDKSRNWKSARNSMSTLLANGNTELHQYIFPLALKVEGKEFNTVAEEYQWMESVGFKTPEHDTIKIASNEGLVNAVRQFSGMDLIYKSDGCVITLNDYSLYYQFDTSGKYDYARRAYRLFNWKSDYYCSILVGVDWRYNSKEISLGLNILPTQVSNGGMQTRLDANNLSRIQYADITTGSIIVFRMQSDSYPEWLEHETKLVNAKIKTNSPLPEYLIQPVAQLEERVRNEYSKELKLFN